MYSSTPEYEVTSFLLIDIACILCTIIMCTGDRHIYIISIIIPYTEYTV